MRIMFKALKKINGVMGAAGIAVAVIYWFDLDDKMVAFQTNLMKKMLAKKAA